MSLRNKITVVLLPVMIVVAFLLLRAVVAVTVTGSWEGLFLLRGHDRPFELKDDLYLNEGSRFIAGVDFSPARKLMRRIFKSDESIPYLEYSWNEKTGAGYVRNFLDNNRQVLTCFSRFVDERDRNVAGLFVGGGLPANVQDDDIVKENETGMAYHDGKRWFHVWCNVNEALFTSDSFEPLSPSLWRFLGSRVLHSTKTELILESMHEVMVDRMPLRIERYVSFAAGEAYFVLKVVIHNEGDKPATFSYLYADEPWLGNYGSSAGNVGWSGDGLHKYVGKIDTTKNNFAGLFDYGNDAAGENHSFTMVANFIQWFGNEKPISYFSNGPYDTLREKSRSVPLSGNTRFVGVLWGPRTLEPHQAVEYTMAVGMASRDAKTGFPEQPSISVTRIP
jgi:hypothetical protein